MMDQQEQLMQEEWMSLGSALLLRSSCVLMVLGGAIKKDFLDDGFGLLGIPSAPLVVRIFTIIPISNKDKHKKI
jgi:hypothetical protein